jgi:hypothetical protein
MLFPAKKIDIHFQILCYSISNEEVKCIAPQRKKVSSMRNPKESYSGTKAGYGTGSGTTSGSSATQPSSAATTMEYCHGSVCLGNQKPTHCICPTDKK